MTSKRQGEIAYSVLKRIIREKSSLRDIGDTRRRVGNLSKETGISEDELILFGKLILREAFEEQMTKLGKTS